MPAYFVRGHIFGQQAMEKISRIPLLGFSVGLLLCIVSMSGTCSEDTPAVINDEAGIRNLISYDNGEIPVESFFKNPEKTAYTISPNGEYIAYLAPYNNRLNIFIRSTGDDAPRRLTSETDRDLSAYLWKNNNTLLFIKDNNGDENYKLFSVTTEGVTKQITDLDGVRINIIDVLPDSEDEVIISMNKDNRALFEPYRVNIQTGALHKLAFNNNLKKPITQWLCDNKGNVRIAVSVEQGTITHLLYRNHPDSAFHSILSSNWKDMVQPMFFDSDNYHIYALSNLNRDKAALVRIDPADPQHPELIFEHPEVDIWWAESSRRRKVLTAYYFITDKKNTVFTDPKLNSCYEYLKTQLPNKEIYFSSIDDKEENIIVRTYSDVSPGRYYLFNAVNHQLDQLAILNESIQSEEMSPMQPISFNTRDGLTVHGYLTIPIHSEGKHMPLVMIVHGGPMSRDMWGFKPEVQMLASRGYAVLQINYRGSWGYGKAFSESGFKQWGRKMQDDLTDGVNWLVQQGIADPERIAIYGSSYGGYAALAGLTFTPDLYACGIDYVGPSNLFTLLANLPAYWEPEKEMLYEMIGHPVKDSALLAEVSPVLHADKIVAPLFIAQGANDPRVTELESQQMVDALLNRNIHVVYMLKENEGHGFRLEENRLEFYKAMCGFLALHMPAIRVNP